MNKEIIFKISKDGCKIDMEAFGFSGETCLNSTKAFIEKMGLESSTEMKDEYYESEDPTYIKETI